MKNYVELYNEFLLLSIKFANCLIPSIPDEGADGSSPSFSKHSCANCIELLMEDLQVIPLNKVIPLLKLNFSIIYHIDSNMDVDSFLGLLIDLNDTFNLPTSI